MATFSVRDPCNVPILLLALTIACQNDARGTPSEPRQNPTFVGHTPATVDPYDPDAGLAVRVDALFSSTCTGGPETNCHGAGAAGLRLRMGSGGDLLNVPSSERPDMVRVLPFEPVRSYLYLKVLDDGGIDGGRMPLGGDVDSRRSTLVGSWIEAGAPSP